MQLEAGHSMFSNNVILYTQPILQKLPVSLFLAKAITVTHT